MALPACVSTSVRACTCVVVNMAFPTDPPQHGKVRARGWGAHIPSSDMVLLAVGRSNTLGAGVGASFIIQPPTQPPAPA